MPTTTDRSPKDFAIEFGEYLADAAERFQAVMQDVFKGDYDQDDVSGAWGNLDSAIYEFRKRAYNAGLGGWLPRDAQPQPEPKGQ